VTDIAEYRTRVADLLRAVESGIVRPSIWRTFALAEAAEAHAVLEDSRSAGTVLLKP